jgi:hypothetical protein
VWEEALTAALAEVTKELLVVQRAADASRHVLRNSVGMHASKGHGATKNRAMDLRYCHVHGQQNNVQGCGNWMAQEGSSSL